MKFNLGQRVKVVKDIHGFFIASEGTVSYLGKNIDGKSLYGIEFYKVVDPLLKDNIGDEVYYFEEDELESIDNVDIEYTFIKGTSQDDGLKLATEDMVIALQQEIAELRALIEELKNK